MGLSRRGFIKGLAALASGILVPEDVAAEPDRRVWALDRSMMGSGNVLLANYLDTDWFDGSLTDPRITHIQVDGVAMPLETFQLVLDAYCPVGAVYGMTAEVYRAYIRQKKALEDAIWRKEPVVLDIGPATRVDVGGPLSLSTFFVDD